MGHADCIESFTLGRALAAWHRALGGGDADGNEIGQRAAAGDDVAGRAFALYEEALARALAMVVNLIDPRAIVLGGGVSNNARIFANVPKLWERWTVPKDPRTKLVRAAHGDASGVRGAAFLERRTLTWRALLPWLLTAAGCQLLIGQRGVDSMPRKTATVSVMLAANTPALGAAALKALAVQPNIEASWPADAEDANEDEQVRAGPRRRDDYLARAYLDAAELIDTHHESQGAYAAVRLDLSTPAPAAASKPATRGRAEDTRARAGRHRRGDGRGSFGAHADLRKLVS